MAKKYDIIADLKRSYPEDSAAYKTMFEAISSSQDALTMVLHGIESTKGALESNNFFAKALAAYVRYHMEEFHGKYLSDEQMRELNPIIRNAIFTLLEDISESRYFKIMGCLNLNLPSYWEDCEYLND